MGEPTYDDLQTEWNRAIQAEGIPGAHADALQSLQRLRDAKSTWFGERENNLRFALDKYLRGRDD